MSARFVKRIVCFRSDVDFGVTTRLHETQRLVDLVRELAVLGPHARRLYKVQVPRVQGIG